MTGITCVEHAIDAAIQAEHCHKTFMSDEEERRDNAPPMESALLFYEQANTWAAIAQVEALEKIARELSQINVHLAGS